MRHIWCSSKAASGNMMKYLGVCASRSSRSVKSSQSEKSSRYNSKEQAELTTRSACITWGRAKVRRKRVHGTIEKERAELATHSVCVTWGGAKVHVSQSSRSVKSFWSVKSSRYNRKRASGAHHMKCVRHMGAAVKLHQVTW